MPHHEGRIYNSYVLLSASVICAHVSYCIAAHTRESVLISLAAIAVVSHVLAAVVVLWYGLPPPLPSPLPSPLLLPSAMQ